MILMTAKFTKQHDAINLLHRKVVEMHKGKQLHEEG
jgi:hypothetical protein